MKSHVTLRSIGSFVLATLILVCLPALAHAQNVRVNWSQRAAFSDYKTYQWIPSRNENHPFYRQYVGDYVNAALQKRGLQPSQTPDLLVTYHFLTQQTVDTETNGFGDGGWGGWGGWGMGGMYNSTTMQVPRTMGLLTVDMIDAKTRKIVWRGQATEDNVVKNNKGEEKDVAKSIHKMLSHFPPK